MIQVTSKPLNSSLDYQSHIERRRNILKKYPEIKNYFGNYPQSMIFIIVLVILQWSIAWLVKDLPWWMVGLISLFIGQFVIYSLSTLAHEAFHNLIFRGRVGTVLSLLMIELGAPVFGNTIKYISIHTSHHLHLNEDEKDYELRNKNKTEFLSSHLGWRVWQAFLHLLPGGSSVLETIFDYILERRISSPDYRLKVFAYGFIVWFLKEIRSTYKQVVLSILFIATSFGVYALAWYFIGPKASLYFFWSFSLTIGNWGVGPQGHSICAHNLYQKGKTYSSYNLWSNFLFFNRGYHDEHHTFPNVPWVHLPKIKQIAPEYFTNDAVYSYFDWWWLWAKSCFHPTDFKKQAIR